MSLTHHELAELDRLAAKIADRPIRFLEIVDLYRRFVTNLNGYDFSIYDYDNDVSSREIIDRILGYSDDVIRAKALEEILPLDTAFIDATIEQERQYTGKDWACRWYRRIPKFPGPELASDIEKGNL